VEGQLPAQEDWIDVTNGGQYYVVNNLMTWRASGDDYHRIVLGDDKTFTREYAVEHIDGVMDFDIEVDVSPLGEQPVWLKHTLPMASTEVWLNDRALIEGLDYSIDLPTITITNKEWIDHNSETQSVRVLIHGFQSEWLDNLKPEGPHYVKHGTLSFNHRYDLRDDKVMRCVVGGRVIRREELGFAENSGDVGAPSEIAEGTPYSLYPVYTPLRGVVIPELPVEQDVDRAIDQEVANYLSVRLPQTDPGYPPVIPGKYNVYSPFINRILHDFINGLWLVSEDRITDDNLELITQRYHYLLDRDPARWDLDFGFVAVHPHIYTEVITVSAREYSILERLSQLYLKGNVDLTHFLQIGQRT
ncbi:hypothetical protein, partial [Endozoicomonas sp. ONNA1]|uniref:DUF7193 family protein n=1 Tax=Endozoicomonas sp. ONNA1 TaxID=2828740 RepID=UPI00214750B6